MDVSTPPFVTIENRTDQPLIDVTVGIKSGMLTYTDSVSRLEAKEKRQLRHAEFSSRDGTSFNLRIARPTTVSVTARDTTGKKFETDGALVARAAARRRPRERPPGQPATRPARCPRRFIPSFDIAAKHWIRSAAAMTLLEICEFIENSHIGTSIRESNYYWMLNGVHVLGLGISAGAIFWFDLRAMGLNMRHMRVSEVYRQINAWMLGGFAADGHHRSFALLGARGVVVRERRTSGSS